MQDPSPVSSDSAESNKDSQIHEALTELEETASEINSSILNKKSVSGMVILPAGSADGLKSAVDKAGPHGIVLVKSGLHVDTSVDPCF